MTNNVVDFAKIAEIAHHVLVAFDSNGLRHLMHGISVSEARNWELKGQYYLPSSVKTICPTCNKPSSLTLQSKCQGTQLGQIIYGLEGECTQCPGKAQIWVISPSTKQPTCKSIWMLPIPTGTKEPIQFPQESIPERILKAYHLAIQCFNSRIWSSAINECGRVIEGITEDKFDSEEERQELSKILKELDKNQTVEGKLFRSILELSSAIRLSRKSGSHFRFTDDPDPETASKAIELTEYTLEYFYSLPKKVEYIKELIDKLEKSKEKKQENTKSDN